MSREEYFNNLQKALADGRISEDAFWCGIENIDCFCEDEDNEIKS